MAAIEITDLGITLKSFKELRQELQDAWIAQFGNAIDLSPTSIDGHHIDLECKTITSVSQLLQAIVSNFDTSKAGGVWLDILGDYKSMSRIEASYSVAKVTFHGTENVVVRTPPSKHKPPTVPSVSAKSVTSKSTALLPKAPSKRRSTPSSKPKKPSPT